MEKIEFTKMHGAGNDYVYINALDSMPAEDVTRLASRISDRHFGVGGDGLVLIMRSDCADFRMRMFNADGSEAQMCGNASRCIGKYVYDKGLTDKRVVSLETLGGIKILNLHIGADGKVASVTVDMGEPHYRDVFAPSIGEERSTLECCGGERFSVIPVNMGNPHGVIFTEEITDNLVLGAGPQLECHEAFPYKANIEFARIMDRDNIEMRVWERGSGETWACGTGACATAVAAIKSGLTDRRVTLHLRGGDLEIFWDPDTNHVMMTGGATMVADGVYYYE